MLGSQQSPGRVQSLEVETLVSGTKQAAGALNIPQKFCLIYQEFQSLSLEGIEYGLCIQEMPECAVKNLLVHDG